MFILKDVVHHKLKQFISKTENQRRHYNIIIQYHQNLTIK